MRLHLNFIAGTIGVSSPSFGANTHYLQEGSGLFSVLVSHYGAKGVTFQGEHFVCDDLDVFSNVGTGYDIQLRDCYEIGFRRLSLSGSPSPLPANLYAESSYFHIIDGQFENAVDGILLHGSANQATLINVSSGSAVTNLVRLDAASACTIVNLRQTFATHSIKNDVTGITLDGDISLWIASGLYIGPDTNFPTYNSINLNGQTASNAGAATGIESKPTDPGMFFFANGKTTWTLRPDGGFQFVGPGGTSAYMGDTNGSYTQWTLPGVTQLLNWAGGGGTFTGLSRTPAQITVDQNNYNPGGYSFLQRWNSSVAVNVTGLTFTSAQGDGQTHIILNSGTQNITLKNESASSTAANRFHTSSGADVVLGAGLQAMVIYDGPLLRWIVNKMVGG
jgi:hypothetical protein